MAKWGTVDYRQLQKLRDNLVKLQKADMEKFCTEMSRELAGRLLALVIPATPVGKYPKSTGKTGGTLRRGWTGKKAGGNNAIEYAAQLPVKKSGTTYEIEVINPVYYASYVEFGHRAPGGNGWVPGQYFLTKSEQILEKNAPKWIDKKLSKVLWDAFDVR